MFLRETLTVTRKTKIRIKIEEPWGVLSFEIRRHAKFRKPPSTAPVRGAELFASALGNVDPMIDSIFW
jgi:hypothetical protein